MSIKWIDTGQIWLHFLSLQRKKIIVLPPSSWRQADVHRTSAFSFSNLSVLDFSKQKNDLSKQVVFCLSLIPTLDVTFSSRAILKNYEKSFSFRSQVSTNLFYNPKLSQISRQLHFPNGCIISLPTLQPNYPIQIAVPLRYRKQLDTPHTVPAGFALTGQS